MHRPLLACAAAVLLLPAAAQARDCKADGTLVVDSASVGTQAVSRDPRSPQSSWVTYSATVRNASGTLVTFTVRFLHPSLQQNIVMGQSWTLMPGQRSTVVIGNALPPGLTSGQVRDFLALDCN